MTRLRNSGLGSKAAAFALLVGALGTAWPRVASAHGAVYPVMPPAPPPAPVPSPVPTAPLPPGPGFPSTPTNPGPASTGNGTPIGPGTGGPGSVSTGGTGLPGVATGGSGSASGPDATSWEWWWFHNQDRFLGLREHIDARTSAVTSEAEFFGNGTSASAGDVVAEKVVPALLAILANETQPDLVTSAMVALARMCDGPLAPRAPEFGRAMSRFQTDGSQEVAETSVLARGLSGDESAVFELAGLLQDDASTRARLGGRAVPARTRAFAAYALGLVGLRARNEDVRRYVVHNLSRALRADASATPDVAVACVLASSLTPLEWSEDSGPNVEAPANVSEARKIARESTTSRQQQIESLLAQFVDTKVDRYVRAHVPGALARLLHDAGAAPLAGARAFDPAVVLETRRVEARVAVARALLASLAVSTEPEMVRQGCVTALGRIADGDREAIDVSMRAALAGVTRDGDVLSRRLALVALAQSSARSGPDGRHEATADARKLLTERLEGGKSGERAWSALALGLLEHRRRDAGDAPARAVAAALVAALQGAGTPEELGAVAIACGLAQAEGAAEILMEKLPRAGDARARANLSTALGLLGDSRARPILRAQIAEARFQPDLLRATGIGLALLEDPEITNELVTTLRTASSQASQSAAASVLGWTGDRGAIEPLLTFLSSREASATARAYAAAALGRVCDRDRLPWNAAFGEDVHYRAATATLSAGDGTGLLDLL